MPLSEFLLKTTKSKPGTAQSKMPIPNSSSSDPFSISDHEFGELRWENGQIVLHGHSGRSGKKSCAATSDHAERAPAKENADSVHVHAKNDQLGAADLPVHHEDDMVPWINFRIDDESLDADPVHNDFYSEFLEDIGILGQEAKSPQHAPQEIPSKAAPAAPAAPEPGRGNKPTQLIQLSQNCQSAVTNNNSRVSELGNGGGGSSGGKAQMGGSCMELVKNMRLAPRPNAGVNFVNFPLFSRPHAVKINDRVRTEEKASAAPVNSKPVESTSGVKSVAGIRAQPRKLELEKPDYAPRHQHVEVPIERIEANRERGEDHATEKDNKNAATVKKDCSLTKPQTEKGPEPVVAPSSVCSVNSAGIESYEPKNSREKRKVSEREESSGEQSDDLEDESVGTKKPVNGRGTGVKRTRAAEVHNLSERRRRDRINEKMRALQELIPNCNKTDKASMLEEAIEYLKTLQLQLQMMSMRNGMYMPTTPVMLPPGMQHINGPAMAHFSPMGVGMGMGMGMGMGYGMHVNGSPGCSLIPVQPMHGQQFPCPPIAGQPALHRMMLGPANPPVFGAIAPHQRSSPPCPIVKGNIAPEVTTPSSAPPPSTSDPATAPVSKDRKQEGKKL